MFMPTFFLMSMVCVATAYYDYQRPKCPLNMEYRQCGTRCPETCAERGPRPCVRVCEQGCFCKEGYILEYEGGKCIPESQCPQEPKCPLNMEYRQCGTRCPETCTERGPRPCVRVCQQGCFCKEGYVLEYEGGKCIPESQCPHDACPPNEEYNSCGTACPETCANKPFVCTANCVAGCFCKEGFVRFTERGRCVPRERCKRLNQ